MRETSRLIVCLALVLLISEFSFGSPQAASGATLTTLHAFCSKQSCADGSNPTGLIVGKTGSLFGVAGTVAYELSPDTGSYTVIHKFCRRANCRDGSDPFGTLVEDVNGNLYGTTLAGGAFNHGTVFELTPIADGKWSFTTLYSFCHAAACADGEAPQGTLTYAGASFGETYDGGSPLFGVAWDGNVGPPQDNGVVFQLKPSPGKTRWREKVLYTLCGQPNCADGSIPAAGLIADKAGHIFGTTIRGGESNWGTAFELSPSPNQWDFTVLYNFCTLPNCADGIDPHAPVLNRQGDLFAVANAGGAYSEGAVFKIKPNGTLSIETVLHSFCKNEFVCEDGANPWHSLIIDGSGALIGAAEVGGSGDGGVVFMENGHQESVLYNFCSLANCEDGEEPGYLAVDGAGNIYGTTDIGGPNNKGTVFKLTP